MIQMPKVFIGSSTEGLTTANDIKTFLKDKINVRIWNEDLFRLNNNYLAELIEITNQYDFAILVLSPDDVIKSRNREELSPRDNIIFEIGLFIGKLGKDRTFIVYDKSRGIKIPSDLFGISLSEFSSKINDNISLIKCCSKILRDIESKGTLKKINETRLTHSTPRTRRLVGSWEGEFSQYSNTGILTNVVDCALTFGLEHTNLFGDGVLTILENEKKINLKLENGFFDGTILKLDYYNQSEYIKQFGSFLLKLDSTGEVLKGRFIGFSPTHEVIIDGTVILRR